MSSVSAGPIDHLETLFKIKRVEKPYACRFDLHFTPAEKKACEDLEYKILILSEHFFPREDTDALFYDVYEAPPKACMQFRKESRYKEQVLWPCLFWGIREKIKYEILSQMQNCGVGDWAQSIRELELFYETCSTQIKLQFGEAGAAKVLNEVCRSDEYVKFIAAVKDANFISMNRDLLNVVQPSFEKAVVPDYFFLLNRCDRKKVKRQRRYAQKPVPKNECKENIKDGKIFDLAQKTFSIVNISENLENKKEGLQKILSEELVKKIKDPKTSDQSRSLFQQMLNDQKYLKKTADVYSGGEEQKVRSLFEKELSRTSKIIDQKNNHDYSIEEQDLFLSEKVESNEKKKKESAISSKKPVEFSQKPVSNEKETKKEELKKASLNIAVKAKPIESKSDQNRGSAPKTSGPAVHLRTKDQLYQDGLVALSQFKQGKSVPLDLARYFLEIEFDETSKNARERWEKEITRLEGWKKFLQKRQQKSHDRKLNEAWQLYQISKELHKPFMKKYSRDENLFTNCFSGKGCNCEGQTKFLSAFLQMANYKPAEGEVLASQHFSDHVQLVVWNKKENTVKSVLTGEVVKGIVAPLYDPLIWVDGYLRKAGVSMPTTDEDFLIAKKNVVDKKNKGESPNVSLLEKVESKTVVPLSDVSYSGGRPIPKTATIGEPLNPDSQDYVINNPMRGSSGARVKTIEHYPKGISDQEKLLRESGYLPALGNELSTGLSKVGQVIGMKYRAKLLDRLIAAGKFSDSWKRVTVGFDEEKNENIIIFKDPKDKETFEKISTLDDKIRFIYSVHALSLASQKRTEQFVRVIEDPASFAEMDTGDIVDMFNVETNHLDPDAAISGAIDLFNADLEQSLPVRLGAYVFKTGKIAVYSGKQASQYLRSETYASISDTNKRMNEIVKNRQLQINRSIEVLKQKFSESPEQFVEFASKLEGPRQTFYINFLKKYAPDSVFLLPKILGDKVSYEIVEKGIPEIKKVGQDARSDIPYLKSEKKDRIEEDGTDWEVVIEESIGSRISKSQKHVEIKPKVGEKRLRSNFNPDPKKIKISPQFYLDIALNSDDLTLSTRDPYLLEEIIYQYDKIDAEKKELNKFSFLDSIAKKEDREKLDAASSEMNEILNKFYKKVFNVGPEVHSEKSKYKKGPVVVDERLKRINLCGPAGTDGTRSCKSGFALSKQSWKVILRMLTNQTSDGASGRTTFAFIKEGSKIENDPEYYKYLQSILNDPSLKVTVD